MTTFRHFLSCMPFTSRGVVGVTLILASLFLSAAAIGQVTDKIQPIFEGCYPDPAEPSLCIAVFGYESRESLETKLPSGRPQNYFTPGPTYPGQVQRFEPGIHHGVNSIPIDRDTALQWTIFSRSATGSSAHLNAQAPISYQGELRRDGARVTGEVSLRFSLFNDLGDSFGPVVTMDGAATNFFGGTLPKVMVTNGLFSTVIPYPAIVTARASLQVEVKMADDADFVKLGDAQPLTGSPFSAYSERTRSIYQDDDDTAVVSSKLQVGPPGAPGSTNANQLQVIGDASKTTAGAWLANSDARIKTGVEPVKDAVETLEKVRLVSFRYTGDYRTAHPEIADHPYLNVIAQEFQKVFPEWVSTSGEKLSGGEPILQVDTYPLTIYSAAAVQELSGRLKTLEGENHKLQERLDRLEKKLEGAP